MKKWQQHEMEMTFTASCQLLESDCSAPAPGVQLKSSPILIDYDYNSLFRKDHQRSLKASVPICTIINKSSTEHSSHLNRPTAA